MPREIADSDAESDLDSPRPPAYSPIAENAHMVATPNEVDPLDSLNFSQYLSPTQRLSSMLEQQEQARNVSQSSGSTDRFLRELAQGQNDLSNGSNTADDSTNKQKRRFDDIENGIKSDGGDRSKNDIKRTKTHRRSRSRTSELPSSLFSPTSEVAASIHPPLSYSNSPNSAHFQRPQHFRENGLQTRPTSFLTTRSSVGGYQGIEMDFRGAGLGMDINTNPFGSLSQVSMEGETRAPIHQAQADPPSKPIGELHTSVDLRHALHPATLDQMATSPPQIPTNSNNTSESRDKSQQSSFIEVTGADLARDTEKPNKTPGAHKSASSESASDTISIVQLQAPPPEPRKRGRKPKNVSKSQVLDIKSSDMDELHDDSVITPQELQKSRPSRSRAGTLEQASDPIDEPTSRSHKRRRSTTPLQTNESPAKHASSELHLSDPNLIGLPAEVYNPRPSKSRARRIVEDEADDLEHRESSPAQIPDVEEAPAKSAKKSKKEKTKKSKSTNSAEDTLAPKSVLDNTDDTIIEIFRKSSRQNSPTETKIDGRMSPVASEISVPDPSPDESLAPKKISIDIPTVASSEDKPPPKKRGRKAKKKVEVQADPEPEPEVIDQEDQEEQKPTDVTDEAHNNDEADEDISPSTTRAPLSERPTNLPSTPTPPTTKETTPLPSKPNLSTTTAPSLTNQPSLSSLIKLRVGLSRKHSIPSLLRRLDRTKEPPKIHEKKEKLTKKQKEAEEKRRLEMEMDGDEYEGDEGRWKERGDDGMLVEWND